jgi:hypothetical protein
VLKNKIKISNEPYQKCTWRPYTGHEGSVLCPIVGLSFYKTLSRTWSHCCSHSLWSREQICLSPSHRWGPWGAKRSRCPISDHTRTRVQVSWIQVQVFFVTGTWSRWQQNHPHDFSVTF